MKIWQIAIYFIISTLSFQLLAQDEQTYEVEELVEIFANFEIEDFDGGGKQQIINNLVASLNLKKNSSLPIDLLDAHKNDYSSLISSRYPVRFSFNTVGLKHYEVEEFLEKFNQQVKLLSQALCLKHVDGDAYLPISMIIIALTWSPHMHIYIQNKYRELQANELDIEDGAHGAFAYYLTTLFGGSQYILKHVKAFTHTNHEARHGWLQPKNKYVYLVSETKGGGR